MTTFSLCDATLVSVPSTGRSGLQLCLRLFAGFSVIVSVPSTGRSGLQRGGRYISLVDVSKFQYPLRVEVGCNRQWFPGYAFRVGVSVPSTGRSGLQLGELPNNGRRSTVSVPSTGRSGLQLADRLALIAAQLVSVPSTGRSGLQRLLRLFGLLTRRGFSTLYGSKWVATFWRSLLFPLSFCFSTLYGSKWVATFDSPRRGCRPPRFSTLYGSKWVATSIDGPYYTNTRQVSVPSTGRSGLQQEFGLGGCCENMCFSTLYGSKWVATPHAPSVRDRSCMFQYPLRVEVGCNANRRCSSVSLKAFQYPLRVEVGCNSGNAHCPPPSSRGFSTLYGSKWVATSALRTTPQQRLRFQYPLRVEVGCNRACWC